MVVWTGVVAVKIEVVGFWIYFENRVGRMKRVSVKKNIFRVFGLSNWKDEVVDNYDGLGQSVRGRDFGGRVKVWFLDTLGLRCLDIPAEALSRQLNDSLKLSGGGVGRRCK